MILVSVVEGGWWLHNSGCTNSFGAGLADVWLIKIGCSWNGWVWGQTQGGTRSDGKISPVQTSDGGYVIADRTGSYGTGGMDAWLVETGVESGLGRRIP